VGDDDREDQAEDDPWAALAPAFVDGHYRSVRGTVRTHVIHHHLLAHLPPAPARVVDVGGGAGHQALPLARAGYEVTVVDPSPAMLERAADAVRGEPLGVAARVRLVQARGEAAPGALLGERFDAVLCHGVLMYVSDPAPLVAALAELASPGAVVSIAARNRLAQAARPALRGEWAEALAAFDAPATVNGLGLEARGDTVEGISRLLEEGGVEPVAWYGVRLFTDGWLGAEPEVTEDLLAVELEASRRDPYRQMSRLFHLVGIRRQGLSPGRPGSGGAGRASRGPSRSRG
jgi:2-polyprenyl-3-methyl-5-hydroxy-6-metoxy-1,4-benzoquinol methylase